MPGVDVAEPAPADGFLQAPALSWAAPVGVKHARRSHGVRVAKYVLPLIGLALLSSIALWPEIARNFDHTRVTWRRLAAISPNAGQMLHPRYRGVDQKQHPYTISADSAQRDGIDRVNLVAPVGDMTLENGTWVLLKGKTGVFMQHANELDLARDVTLYRQDGTVMTSDTATMNLKQGAATSSDFTHAEGPFGKLRHRKKVPQEWG